MKIDIQLTKTPREKIPADKLGFGKVFSDHMFLMDYDPENGWHDARIVPFGNFSVHPASTVFHYGEEIFEGLKAYRRADGQVQMFRPIENCRRMNSSAERLCLPQIPEEDMLEAILKLVEIDQDWVPAEEGCSLYIRPFMFGNDEALGVHTVHHSTFCVICSPSGSYYPEGINPVKIMIEDEDVRAVRGGTGYTKCGGNYGASLRAGISAEAKGYTQVLWLDGVDRKYIEEVGAMNIMFVIDGEIVTPELQGSILPGITRKSVLELTKSWGMKVSERRITIQEIADAYDNGKLDEVFGTGTAAVISPVGHLKWGDKVMTINNNKIGPISQKIYDTMTGIQWGKLEDPFGWVVPVK